MNESSFSDCDSNYISHNSFLYLRGNNLYWRNKEKKMMNIVYWAIGYVLGIGLFLGGLALYYKLKK